MLAADQIVSRTSLWSIAQHGAEACLPVGQVTISSIGDTVWVMFEDGDIRFPVWVGVRPGRAA